MNHKPKAMHGHYEIIYTKVPTGSQDIQRAASKCPEGVEARWPTIEPG